jgi:hypothetical protein
MTSETKSFDRAEHMRSIRAAGTAASVRKRAIKRLAVAAEDVLRLEGAPDEATAEVLRELLARTA